MVHVEHTPVAGGTVMAPFRLKNIAHQAVSSSLVLRIAKMEPPEDWNLTRIGSHRLYERPNEHEKDNIENCEHDYDSRVVCVKEKLELLM